MLDPKSSIIPLEELVLTSLNCLKKPLPLSLTLPQLQTCAQKLKTNPPTLIIFLASSDLFTLQFNHISLENIKEKIKQLNVMMNVTPGLRALKKQFRMKSNYILEQYKYSGMITQHQYTKMYSKQYQLLSLPAFIKMEPVFGK